MTRTSSLFLGFVLLTTFASTGCTGEDDPVAYSEAISLRLGGIKDSDVRDGEASVDKKVNDETGHPYREFLDTARLRLHGHDPSSILVSSADIRVAADTTGVNGFQEVFTTMELFLHDDRTTIPVGFVDTPNGTTTRVEVFATRDDLAPLYDTLMTEEVRVGVRGPVVESPPMAFDLRMSVDIVFEALP